MILKTQNEIKAMRKPGRMIAKILEGMTALVEAGITTAELNRYAELRCQEFGCRPLFKGYRGFPGSVCISVNEEAIHGIPSNRILLEGDIVGLDFGVEFEGWCGDSAVTVEVGSVDSKASRLIIVTKESLFKGIEQCIAGNRISDIGHAVQTHAESNGYGVIRGFSGHGIGRDLHESPDVLNYGEKGNGLILRVGMVLAIEPMVTIGSHETKTLEDGWTVSTVDKSLAAHFEHTVAITMSGPEILTRP